MDVTPNAKKEFDSRCIRIVIGPSSRGSLYWRGAGGRRWRRWPGPGVLSETSDRLRNYYYGEMARQRLNNQATDDPPHLALIDRVRNSGG